MLVLSRKIGEKILIGDNIAVTVVRVTGGGVRIGIEAPPELAVVREELARALKDSDDSIIPLKDAKVPANGAPRTNSPNANQSNRQSGENGNGSQKPR